eukprot:365861-Chlamydomonas_euryale.AAC.23
MALASDLLPIARMASPGGPTNAMPACRGGREDGAHTMRGQREKGLARTVAIRGASPGEIAQNERGGAREGARASGRERVRAGWSEGAREAVFHKHADPTGQRRRGSRRRAHNSHGLPTHSTPTP